MHKHILILGKGYIGKRLQGGINCPITAKRITTYKDIDTLIKQHRPQVLINSIGHIGKTNVDDCELAFDKTLQSNVMIPVLLGEAALRHNLKLVHISTGCIFHYDSTRQRPIKDDQIPDYYDLYCSRTKIYAENILRELAQKANILIVRIRIPLDTIPNRRNILTKLLQFDRIIDTPNSATYLPDFIDALRHLIKIDARGIYNVVNKGALQYSQLLKLYQKYHPEFHYKLVEPGKLNKNRTNLILSTQKLEKSGFKVRTITSVLRECINQYVSLESKTRNDH